MRVNTILLEQKWQMNRTILLADLQLRAQLLSLGQAVIKRNTVCLYVVYQMVAEYVNVIETERKTTMNDEPKIIPANNFTTQ